MAPRPEKIDISIIIPALNEENKIRATVNSYIHALEKESSLHAFELILVSNNCSDSTPSICRELAHQNPLKIIHLNIPFYTGKGGAVMKGFSLARYPFLAFVDADNAIEPREFLKLISSLHDPKMGAVISSRLMKDSKLIPPQPIHRRVLGLGYTLSREILLGLGVQDSQCGAKIFRRESIEPFDIQRTGWSFDVELLMRVKDRGYSIREIGITWKDKPGSKISILSPARMFSDLIQLRLNRFPSKSPPKK